MSARLRWLGEQRAEQLRFAAGSVTPEGFGWLDDGGAVDPSRPTELWISCRMTHVFSLALLAGEPAAPGGPSRRQLAELAAHGVSALRGPLHDHDHGGWFASLSADGRSDSTKQAYGHAFVVLAGASASAAGVPGGAELLGAALETHEHRFWDDEVGLAVEQWDRSWTELDPYRGVNANMHTVEAYLAAGDVTGDASWHERAGRIASHVVRWAEANEWRIPEHFDTDWQPLLDHNRDEPAHPFRPFGATVGHGLEWARLLLAVQEALGAHAPPGLLPAARALFERAVDDGWDQGRGGFVYTTDWHGTPVVRTRMHWVLVEAVAAAVALQRATGDPSFDELAEQWWAWADEHLVDRTLGSWHHELDETNRPASQVWPGKPDAYHVYQATLLPVLSRATSFVGALASR